MASMSTKEPPIVVRGSRAWRLHPEWGVEEVKLDDRGLPTGEWEAADLTGLREEEELLQDLGAVPTQLYDRDAGVRMWIDGTLDGVLDGVLEGVWAWMDPEDQVGWDREFIGRVRQLEARRLAVTGERSSSMLDRLHFLEGRLDADGNPPPLVDPDAPN